MARGDGGARRRGGGQGRRRRQQAVLPHQWMADGGRIYAVRSGSLRLLDGLRLGRPMPDVTLVLADLQGSRILPNTLEAQLNGPAAVFYMTGGRLGDVQALIDHALAVSRRGRRRRD